MDGSIWTILVTVVTVLGSTSAWRYYEKRALKRERDEDFLRVDFKDRVSKLETLLDESSREKDEMRNTILRLTEQVAQLTIKVEYLQKENNELLTLLRGG
jgi:hypothetical protein